MMPLRESSRPPRTSVRFSPTGAAGWSLAMVLVQGIAGGLVRPERSTGPIDFVSFGVIALLALLVVLFGVVRVHGPDASLREVVGLDESPLAFPPAVGPRAVLAHRLAVVFACLLAGVALVVIDSAFDEAFMARDANFREEIGRLRELLEAPTTRARVARVLGLGVAQPLAELGFYFGIVFGALRRPRARLLAGGMSLLFFALHASDIRALPLRLLLGITLLGGRMATGTVVASAVATVAFSAVEVAQLGRSAPLLPGGVTVWALVFSAALFALGFLVRASSRWRLGEFADRLDLRA